MSTKLFHFNIEMQKYMEQRSSGWGEAECEMAFSRLNSSALHVNETNIYAHSLR